MLSPATPYPQPGSYALYEDPELPPADRHAELVRIIERGAAVVLVSFPLREGASGNQRVPLSDLIDATPLSAEEGREMTDLQRSLVGKSMRTKAQKSAKARLETLQSRAIWSGNMQRKIDRVGAMRRSKAA